MELYTASIRRAVSVLCTRNNDGLDREDYESILIAHLWRHAKGDFVDYDLANAIIKNKVRDYQRRNQRKLFLVPTTSEESSFDLEQEAINKELIRLLRVVLPSDDWDMLVLYVENDFNTRRTWLRHPASTAYREFHHKLQGLLCYCREIIQSICNYPSGGRVLS